MIRSVCPSGSSAASAHPWRARLACGLVAVALTVPGAAHPYSLNDLLRLPLEQLLQLPVAPRQGGTT
ncbi:MAG: hypothetical protein Q8K96_11160 [Rubrivivax sp.]|nr:hypothetical protein [Rubrivivax sp.]